MKKILTLICTLLCANVLSAQTTFWIGDIQYEIKSTNPTEVEVHHAAPWIRTANIPSTINYYGTTYSVTSIGFRAFEDRERLTSVTIGNGVTSIGNSAFRYCDSLTSVTIGNSVTSIGGNAFGYCSSLTSITIPNSVTSIGSSAFSHCSSLISVTIPNSVTSIGEWAFCYCSSLTSVDIPNSVNTIGASAFRDCDNLTSVTIGNSVTTIGNYAFSYCDSLTSITIPNSITSIERFAFYGCSSLASVTFEDNSSLDTIGYSAFQNCSSLTSITIPNSVTYIGEYAFSGCSSLTSVTIGNSVTTIRNNAFRNCSSLTSITIPNSVTSIGYSAFDNCSSLTSMTIEMNNISNFSNLGLNSILQNLTLGENVTYIGRVTFHDCSSLQNVTCLATTPPTLEDNGVFPYSNTATLTVPCGTLEAYSAPTSYWNTFFAGRISENGYDVVATANDDLFGSVSVANDCSSATLTATANNCYQFVSWNDGNIENPRIIELTNDTSFTAIFEEFPNHNYNVNVSINNDAFGSVSIENDCNSSTLTATANNCYQFVSWNDGNTENPRIVNVSSDTSFVATFEEIVFDTTINATINAGETYAEYGFNESESGTYVQNLQTVNGCDSTITLNLTVNSSLYDVAEFADLSVYPNPTRGKVSFNQAIEKVEVIDLSGKTLQTYENANEINIEALPAGVYHLRMTIEDKTTTRKVIKE